MSNKVISLDEHRTEKTVIFENRYFITSNLLRQFQLVYLCSQTKIVVLWGLFIFMFIIGIAGPFVYPQVKWYTEAVLLLGPVLWAVSVAVKVYRSGKLIEGRAKILNKEKAPEAVVVAGEEQFTVHNPAVFDIQYIRYEKIIRLLNTRSLYVLMIRPGVAVLVKRNSFTKGTDEEFKGFINKKCVNAKGKLF